MGYYRKRLSPAQILLRFLKIGVIGFGGGSALIPVIEREIVGENGPMDEQEFLKHTVVANITPGALPVKLGATCGYQLGGTLGALAGAYGAMLPGVFLTVLILSLFSLMGPQIIRIFNFASVGISTFIVMLLISYVWKVCGTGNTALNWAVCIASFLLTCGTEVRQILVLLLPSDNVINGTPVFDVSTIHLMVIVFLIIIGYTANPSRLFLMLTGILCLGFALFQGQMFTHNFAAYVCLGATLVLIMFALLKNRRGLGKRAGGGWSIEASALATIALFLGLSVIFAVVLTLRYGGQVLSLACNAALSTATSFGGGEAYVSVADGFFIQTGYVGADIYYAQLVPVANALPGPILVKIAAGIGYLFGVCSLGTTAAWLLAIMVATTCTGVCCALAVLITQLYDAVGKSGFVLNLKRFILPVICGMLLSTSLSMLYEASKLTGECGLSIWSSLVGMVIWILLLNFLHRRFRLHDLSLLALSVATSLALLLTLNG